MTSFALTAGAHYVRSLNVFMAKSGERMKIFEILHLHIPPLIQTASPSWYQQRTSFNILSVGSGTGEMDMEIMKIIEKELQKSDQGRRLKIFNRAIEPNEYSCSLYKAAIKNLPSPTKDDLTEFDICQQTFEEYKERQQRQEAGSVKFDMVHFIHSIYHVDIKQALMHCFEKELRGQGVLVCVIAGQDLIYWVTSRQNSQWQGHGRDKGSEKYETAEEIIKIAKDKGWKHEIYSQENFIDVTEVFDKKSTEGNLLLDFLTHTVNFRETADKQQVKETLALIKELSIVKDGKRCGDKKESLVIIYK